jgi:RecA/RadA recombinase
VLVSGASASGKTLFATRVAMAAGRAGMKVSYLDADHSFEHKVLSYFVVEMLQAGGDIRYVSLADQHPYDTTLVDIRVKEALEWADLVIVDEMPRAYARAVDQGTARGWKAAVKSINQRVANDKLPPLTAMVTYTAARVASRPGVVDSDRTHRPGEERLPAGVGGSPGISDGQGGSGPGHAPAHGGGRSPAGRVNCRLCYSST